MQPSAPGELSDRRQQLETSWRAERKTCRARGVRGRPVFYCFRTSGRESKQEGHVMKEAGSRGTRESTELFARDLERRRRRMGGR